MSNESDWKRWYAALKAVEPEAFSKAIQYAEGVSINCHLHPKVAADCEVSHVMLACELLGIKP